MLFVFFFQAEDGIRDKLMTGVQTCALPISGLVVLNSLSFCLSEKLLTSPSNLNEILAG